MIRVFNSDDKLYDTNGNVVLKPTYANVHKEDNGAYYLDIETNLQNEVIKHIEAQAGTNIEINSSATLTDVDATKEAELTALKGQTTQASTPTPSTPQPINVVTGEQNINVCGKNLFNVGSVVIGYIEANCTIHFDNPYRTSDFIPIQPNTTYYKPYTASPRTKFFDKNKQPLNTTTYQDISIGGNSGTFTTPNNAYYFRFSYPIATVDGNTLQIEKGSQATTYEAYKGNSQLISLGVENLLEPKLATTTQSGITCTNNGDGTFTLNGTATSGISFRLDQSTYNGSDNLKAYNGTYTLSCNEVENGLDLRVMQTSTWTSPLKMVNNNTPVTNTFNLNNCFIYINVASGKTLNNLIIKPMLELGSKANSFSPYGASYIELCKIGTYQDKIYKDNGVWYLHKEIGKAIFNGTENWKTWYRTSNSNIGFYYSMSGLATIGVESTYNNALYDDRFTESETRTMIYNGSVEAIKQCGGTGSQYIAIGLAKSKLSNWSTNALAVSSFKTWLSSNNTTVYYVLATPTDTPIEDSELLEQLNSIELLNGLNNISVTSSDLPALLDLHYNYVTGGDVTTGDYLQPNNILVANTPTGNQAFRITSIEKTRHKIKIKANHVFYDSMNYVIQDSYVVDKNLNDALDHLNNATDNTSPFTTLSNVTTINSYRCVRKSLYEAVNVLLERWGGHLVRDNFNLKIMDAIGQDNGVTVRYGKNLKDITVDYNWDNVVTKILPVGYDGVTLDEIYLYSDTQYDIPYTKVVHFDQDIDIDDFRDGDGNVDEDAYTNALKADLRNQASAYLLENSIPKVNYELQANLEKITDVGDIIEVIDERLGVNIMTSLISYDYDCILEKYTTLEFGNFQKKLNDLTSYIETQSSEVANEISTATKVTLQTELNQATSQLWGVLGNSYVIYEGDKILVVDSLPKESATNVLMINSGGIGFSNTGINGTFSSAWTIDGTLNMENINVINLTADLIKGGTLKLGSNINQNGILEVYDEANNLIAQLTKDGLRMNATDGGYLLINTTVGFSGYDRNDNRIYWVDGDEFHMKKSVVEEEITLVDKMRIIPITITENNVIVNDGIGFVSTL